jgi:hypothetical protein
MTLKLDSPGDTISLRDVRWRKSTRSGPASSNCVELGPLPGADGVAVRDSKDRDGGFLVVDGAAWNGFLSTVKRGRFDLG